MTTNADYDSKMQELMDKVHDLEEKTAAFKGFVEPSFVLTDFHKLYDPMTAAAKEAHDIYHELLGLQGHAH
jgi:hypothetical protein